jgi:5,10-methylenetetrahydromethanopterin reductase
VPAPTAPPKGIRVGIGLSAQELGRLGSLAARAEAAGFAFVSVGDNPMQMTDTYVALTLVATSTQSCRIGTTMTNPVRRDPLAAAAAISSIAVLAPGRVFMGISTGRSERASQRRLEAYIEAMRALWDVGKAAFEGETMELLWDAPRVPIMVGASGPVGLRRAGRIADAVIVESGVSAEVVESARAHIDAGARQSGRSIDDLEIWWYVKANLAASYAESLDAAIGGVAASGANVLQGDLDARLVPPRFHDDCRALTNGYDFHSHLKTGPDDPNRRLLGSGPFIDYLADRFALVGSPDDWIERAGVLAERGIRNIFVAVVTTDRAAFVDSMGTDVMPVLAGR